MIYNDSRKNFELEHIPSLGGVESNLAKKRYFNNRNRYSTLTSIYSYFSILSKKRLF